jgi:hypothetical protein
MKNGNAWRWLVLAMVTAFLFYLGNMNYHQRNPPEFVMIILGAVAVLVLSFYFLSDRKMG